MKIEILYFEGCPNHRPAVERVKEALKEEGLTAEVVEVCVPDEAAAKSLGFLGSPTIRIDGLDVEPSARSCKHFGMMCRTYTEGGNRSGLPARELIRSALREAAHEAPPALDSRRRLLWGASVVAAVAASLCCIRPILAAVSGLGVLASAAFFEQWRPYLLGVTGALLAAGFMVAYRDYKKACVPGSLCATTPIRRWNFIALGVVALVVIALAAFPYYSGTGARAVRRQSVFPA